MQESPESLLAPGMLPAPGKYGYFTLFSPRGRMGRLQFFYICLLANIAGALGELAVTVADTAPGIVTLLIAIGVIGMGLLNLSVLILSCIKRVHDWDKPGVHALKLFIPFYSFVLLFREGSLGLNFYGERRYNPHIYWNAALVLLAPVLLMLAFAFGTRALADLAASAPGTLYQDDRNGYTLIVPAGWTREPLEGDADTMQFFSPNRKSGMYVTVRQYEDAPGYTFTEKDAWVTMDSTNMEDFSPDGYLASGDVAKSVELSDGQWYFRMESNGTVDDSPYRIAYVGYAVDGFYYGLLGEQYGTLTQAQKDRMDAFMRSFHAE